MIITLFIFTTFTKCILFAKKIILTEFSFLFSLSVPYEHRDSTINILWKLLFSRNICLRSNFFQDKYLIFFLYFDPQHKRNILCSHSWSMDKTSRPRPKIVYFHFVWTKGFLVEVAPLFPTELFFKCVCTQ